MSQDLPRESKVNIQLEQAIQAILSDRPIAYHAALARALGSVTAGVLLSQFLYWQPRSRDSEGWFWKTQAEIYEETALGRREQETARKVLTKSGVLEEKRRGVPAKMHFRVNLTRLVGLLSNPQRMSNDSSEGGNSDYSEIVAESGELQYGGKRHTRLAETAIPVSGKPPNKIGANEPTITETTAETSPSNTPETTISNHFELQTQVFNGVPTFEISKDKFEDLKNDDSEGAASGDEPDEQQRRGDYQPHTPSKNSFTAVGEVLKGREVRTGRKAAPRSSKTASTAASGARAGVRQGRGSNGLPEPPEWLREHIRRFSIELHDSSEDQIERNLGQAHNLYLFTGAEEGRFVDRLNEAKRITLGYDIQKRAEGEAGEIFGRRNKMPYFFKVLRDLYGLKDVPASKTKPVAARRKGRGHNVNEQFYSP